MADYKSGNKEYLKDFKDYLKSNVELEVAKNTWSFYNKYIFIEDLHKYLRAVTKETINIGRGNYNSNIVIVLPTVTDNTQVNFLKELFSKINIDINNIYITSFYKGNGVFPDIYRDVLNKEILKINPDIVFSVGNHSISFDKDKIIEVDQDNFVEMLELYNKGDLSDVDKATLEKKKKVFWGKLKFIIKYYKG